MARKKTNESTSLNQESLTSGLLSMDDNLPDIQGEYSERDLNTDEGENNAGPLTDAYSTPETQPSSLKAYGTIQPSEGTTCNLNTEESTENPVTDSLSIATPDDKIHGERTVQKPAQASKSVQAKSSKSVHVESSKSDQTESSKAVQDEASKSVQDESSKSVQDDSAKSDQNEAKHQEGKGIKSTNQNNLSEKNMKDNTKNKNYKGDQKPSMGTNTDDTHQSKKQVKSGPQDQLGKQQPTAKQGPAAEKKVI